MVLTPCLELSVWLSQPMLTTHTSSHPHEAWGVGVREGVHENLECVYVHSFQDPNEDNPLKVQGLTASYEHTVDNTCDIEIAPRTTVLQ